MKKSLCAVIFGCVLIAGCGGGDDRGATQITKSLKVSVYGNPLVPSSKVAVAHAAIMRVVADESSPGAASDSSASSVSAAASASDAEATVETLQDALAARGVPAQVSAQVMDGTTLHQIVMGENNGLPPTADQFKTDPSEWIVVNFQLDDMVTKGDDPAQLAAETQFAQDLSVFTQRANVAGKRVFAIEAIPTCDVPNQDSAADGLIQAIDRSQATSSVTPVGGLSFYGVRDANGNVYNSLTKDHLGADCRTPDAYLLNLWTDSIADDLASRYQGYLNGDGATEPK